MLRLAAGSIVEVFDDAGATARGVFLPESAGTAAVRVEAIDAPIQSGRLQWTVAAAVPKGDRADWMVEKLSELGATAFIPLAAARSVVLPEGRGKRDRWMRIATESAKQSRRSGVMQIAELTSLDAAIDSVAARIRQSEPMAGGWVFATETKGMTAKDAIDAAGKLASLTLFIGPEGGWTPAELAAFGAAGITTVRLGESILRIETAAIAAGALVATLLCGEGPPLDGGAACSDDSIDG